MWWCTSMRPGLGLESARGIPARIGRMDSAALAPIAKNHDATIAQIALAWQLQRSPVALPIPGTTNIRHLDENLQAAALNLTADEIATITALTPE